MKQRKKAMLSQNQTSVTTTRRVAQGEKYKTEKGKEGAQWMRWWMTEPMLKVRELYGEFAAESAVW